MLDDAAYDRLFLVTLGDDEGRCAPAGLELRFGAAR